MPSDDTWYVLQRAAANRHLFPSAVLYRRLRRMLLTRLQARQGRLLGYCFAPTEIHVVMRVAPDDGPGRVVQSVAHAYASQVNRTLGHRGHLFAGRHAAAVIADDAALRHAILALIRRPVDLQLARTPAAYRHSSYRAYLGREPAAGLDVARVMALFGQRLPEAREELKQQVRALEPADERTFRAPFEARMPVRGPRAAAPIRRLLARGEPVDAVLECYERWVVRELGLVSVAYLVRSSERAAAEGRALVSLLATAHGVTSAAHVARRYGRDLSTLSDQRRRYGPKHRARLAVPAELIIESSTASRK